MIIGFAGRIGAGKSTAAQHLVRKHGFVLHKFATPLKNMLRVIGCTEADLEGDRKEEPSALFGGRTPRHAMQTLGTEWGRNCIDPDFWARAWERTLPPGCIVADDVRFLNEAKLIRDLGGLVIEIVRTAPRDESAHASEIVDMGEFRSQTIHNVSTVEWLKLVLDNTVAAAREDW